MPEEQTKPEIQEGKIIDFIDGKARSDNELEQIRQNFERTLIEEYRFDVGLVETVFLNESALEVLTNLLKLIIRACLAVNEVNDLAFLNFWLGLFFRHTLRGVNGNGETGFNDLRDGSI